MREFQYICPRCLRLRYGQGPAKFIPDGTLKLHGWGLFSKPSGKTECDFCNHKVRFLWAREVPRTANHQDL